MFLYTELLGSLVNRYGYNLKDGQQKVIIPFYDKDKKLFALQARALDNSEPKYITILLDKNKDKIFGLDRWDESKETIVVEGPIDSLFLPNCLAMAGSDMAKNKYLNTDMIICLDNEPRNAEIISKYSKFIERGFKIVIWPDNVRSKDINDKILENLNPHQIKKENIFCYSCTEYRSPIDERSLIYNDPKLKIKWPAKKLNISIKDKNAKSLDSLFK